MGCDLHHSFLSIAVVRPPLMICFGLSKARFEMYSVVVYFCNLVRKIFVVMNVIRLMTFIV